MTLNRRLSGPTLALVIAALAAAPATARPIDPPLDVQPAGRPDARVRVVEVPADAGFDWTGAGLGAGAMLAAGLGGALVLSIRRRHERAATTA